MGSVLEWVKTRSWPSSEAGDEGGEVGKVNDVGEVAACGVGGEQRKGKEVRE